MIDDQLKDYLRAHGIAHAVDDSLAELAKQKPLPKDPLGFLQQVFAVKSEETHAKDYAKVDTTLLLQHKAMLHEVGIEVETGSVMKKGDVLIVVDYQNDFVPEGTYGVPACGTFGVAEAGSIWTTVSSLLAKATQVGAKIVATRDYHPDDHCSFGTHGGPFPPHCVQGTKGSHFVPPFAKALAQARAKNKDNVHVVFKGFSETIDSFGSFKYFSEHAETRLSCSDEGGHDCSLNWTGACEFKCSNHNNDINAPPDVKAVLSHKTTALDQIIGKGTKTLFVCGLAFDFCVLDTAYNAKKHGYENVVIVYDAARSAHIPGFGKFGTGFLTDPKDLAKKLTEVDLKLVMTADCVGS